MNKKYKYTSTIMVIAVIALIIAANVFFSVLTSVIPIKLDMTPNNIYSIGNKTKEFLEDFDTPTDIYILASESQQDENVRAILDKYSTANSNIKITNINTSENPTFGRKYVSEGQSIQSNSVIVDGGDRFRLFTLSDLYGFNAQTGNINSINVENKITSALRYISSEETLYAYFITGHNEMDFVGAKTELEEQNYTVSELNLITDEIPENASLIISAQPSVDYTTAETAKLDKYMTDGGNIQIYFDVKSQALTNLYDFIKSWGIDVNDNVAIETDTSNAVSIGGSATYLIVPDVEETDFTSSIIENKRTLAYYPYSKSLTVHPEISSAQVSSVLTTSEKAYTTSNYENITKTDSDPTGKFTVAALSKTDKSSLYVSGNTFLLSMDPSQVRSNYGYANYDYFINLVNYNQGGDDNFTVDEKSLISNFIEITPASANVIGIIFAVVIPLLILAVGINVWFKRRNL